MRQFTTPTHTIRLKGVDLTGDNVYVTYTQGRTELEVTEVGVALDGEDTVLTVELTQEQTGGFAYQRTVEVQVNWVTPDGKRDATRIKTIPVDRNNLDRQVEYVE